MTDSGQNYVNQYAYTPFGIIADQVETVPQPFKFVGQHGVMTEPNGLYYMRARFYDPNIGRFISEDPLGFGGGGINLYIYCNNNPLLLIDPEGEAFNFALAGIGAGVGAITGGLSSLYRGESFWKGATIGGLVGATAGFTFGTSLFVNAGWSAGFSAAGDIGSQVYSNWQAGRDLSRIDYSSVFISGLAGGTGGFVGTAAFKGDAGAATSTFLGASAAGGASMYLNYSAGSAYAGGTYK